MAADFDHFIAIDWSARNRPSPARPSRDAIWLAEATARGRVAVRYFRTRRACLDYLRPRLAGLVARRRRVLVGWDFSFGYPKGLARALRLVEKPAWRAVWALVSDLVRDGADNTNNRFEVGARLNRLTGAPGGPFWGVPTGESGIFLGSKRDFAYPVPTKGAMLPERRLVEEGLPRMQPAWKLAYAGSVGGQSLTGIPYLRELRFAAGRVGERSRVWPFERPLEEGAGVLHAEIYPSLLQLPGRDRIPDREQVRTYVRWLQDRQGAAELAGLLAVPYFLPKKARRRVRRHEGWVLGVE